MSRDDAFKEPPRAAADVSESADPAMPGPAMSTEEALGRIAGITQQTHALRSRTEGLTFVLWGACLVGSYLTLAVIMLYAQVHGGLARGAEAPLNEIAFRVAPALWFLVALLGTIGLWRSAALRMGTGVSTPRLILVFVGWQILVTLVALVVAVVEQDRPRAWHTAAWGIVLALFALVNPLRFTERARWSAALAAVVALAAGLVTHIAGLRGEESALVSGVALGVPLVLAGLVLLFRG